jgi:hypothetical protein
MLIQKKSQHNSGATGGSSTGQAQPSLSACDREALQQKYAQTAKIREAKKVNPDKLGYVYLHVGNSGISFSVVDEGFGPTIKIHSSTFGNVDQTIRVHANVESLQVLGEMFTAAAQYKNFNENYCNNAYVSSAEIYQEEEEE